MTVVKKKRDRFKGMSEEEVSARLLPDHLAPDLDIVIVSIGTIKIKKIRTSKKLLKKDSACPPRDQLEY